MATVVRTLDRCIFCDGTDMTEEHLLAGWAHRAFAKSRKPTNMLRGTWADHSRVKFDSGDPVLAAKVICRTCNNDWISGVDNAAAQVLKPLVRGEREVSLDPEGQTATAAWIYKSALILDAAEHGNDGQLSMLRAGFRLSRQAGPGCVIYAGPATPPEVVEIADPPMKVKFWPLGIRAAPGRFRVNLNFVQPDGSVTPGDPIEVPIPGYHVMVGALWAYLGGQVPPVTPDALKGFQQIWPAQSPRVTLTAASLAS